MAECKLRIEVIDTPSEALRALEDIVAWADEIHMAYAWISTGGGQAAHWRALPLGKIRRAIIGTHFAQTDPEALEQLMRFPGILKIVKDTEGVFHPKGLLGIAGRCGRALVGSSNFTDGGFSGNTEFNVMLSGDLDAEPIAGVLAFIDRQWNGPRASDPDDDWLLRYRKLYASRPAPPRMPPDGTTRLRIRIAKDLDVSWRRYYELIVSQERRTLAAGERVHIFDHPEGSYLQEVAVCRKAFDEHPIYAKMPLRQRQLVAGWGADTFGWFGRMGGAGDFKHMTAVDPEQIGIYLDRIPLDGSVPEVTIRDCLMGMMTISGVALGAASRLLTVKRPDLFLTCNNANRKRIREVFGRAPATVSGYMELHQRIWALPWYKSPEPDGIDERYVWRARVALLDALLYEG